MSLSRSLREIADLNNAYDYAINRDMPNKVIYGFTTESGVHYAVGFYFTEPTKKSWLMGFDSVSSRQGKKVNPEKTLNTIFKIVKEFYDSHKNEIDVLFFHADNKRERIYKYYTKKIFPNAQIDTEGHDDKAFVVTIK